MHFPSEWFRFDRYVVADGFIRPAPGAKLVTYRPWEKYQTVRREAVEDPVAYHGLMNFLATVTAAPRSSRRSIGGTKYTFDEQKLRTWVSRNGLLGIAHSQLTLSSAPAPITDDGRPQRAVTFFSGGRWCNGLEDEDVGSEASTVKAAWVVARDLVGGEVRVQDSASWWRTFLPGVRGSMAFDLESDNFRRAYSEPVNAFIDAAVHLRTAIRAVTPAAADSQTGPSSFELGAMALNGLLASGHTTLALGGEGRLEETWTAPSLLAHLAMMVLRDVGDHRHLVKCEVCGNTVLRAKPSKYCGDTHRQTAEKQRQRARAAGKKGRK